MASPMGTRRASRTAVEVETSDADEKIAQLTRQKRELAAELTNKDRIIAELTHKLESETRK